MLLPRRRGRPSMRALLSRYNIILMRYYCLRDYQDRLPRRRIFKIHLKTTKQQANLPKPETILQACAYE